jgi:pimeloyl-ACP methyl ester carboxylesterase
MNTFHPRFTDTQVMLSLALSAYRGVLRLDPTPYLRRTLRRAIQDRCLDRMEPLAGRWQVVWGPGIHRYFAGPTDSLVYLARYRSGGGRAHYAIVVRGTNPIAAVSWLLQDFWVTQTLPWSYGSGSSRISAASWLSLHTVLALRAPGRNPAGSDFLLDLREMLDDVLDVDVLTNLLDAVELEDIVGAVQRLVSDDGLYPVAERERSAGAAFVARTLVDDARADQPSHLPTLLEALTAEVAAERGPVTVHVAGHSLGGVVATTLATYLEEHRGSGTWDPGGDATVEAWSFAGPAAGNGTFAARTESLLGARCHRVANRLDMITRGWDPRELAAFPRLYPENLGVSALAGVFAQMADAVARVGYRQPNSTQPAFDGHRSPAQRTVVQEMAYQHMHAYVDHLGLARHLQLGKVIPGSTLLG